MDMTQKEKVLVALKLMTGNCFIRLDRRPNNDCQQFKNGDKMTEKPEKSP